jgi:hypothetical protein
MGGADWSWGYDAGRRDECVARHHHLCPGCGKRLPRIRTLLRKLAPREYRQVVVCPRCLTASRPGPQEDIDAGRVRLDEAGAAPMLSRAEQRRSRMIEENRRRWQAEIDR